MIELALTDPRVTVPLEVTPPVQRGTVDAWLSATRGGPPARGALVRSLAVRDGVVPAFTVFARDILEQWPRGGRVWVVVSYAGRVLMTDQVRVTS